MLSYQQFIECLRIYCAWAGITIPSHSSICIKPYTPPPLNNFTGSQIRKIRSKATNLLEVVDANHPHMIGVVTPPWTWEFLWDCLKQMPEIDPFEYNYIDYDPKKPGAVYMGDRILLKEFFAGDAYAEYDVGTPFNITQMEGPELRVRTTKYLTALLSQIAQVARKQAQEVEELRDETHPESSESVSEDE